MSVVQGGPAAQAGIKPGDIIVAIDGVSTPTAESLAQALAQLQPGDTANVDVVAPDGSRSTVSVVLGQLPNS